MHPYINKENPGNAKRKKKSLTHVEIVCCAISIAVSMGIIFNEYLNRQYDKELHTISAPIPKYTIPR